MSAPRPPEYIGDGVYIQEGRDPGEIILTTASHILDEADNVIFLAPEHVKALVRYIELTGEARPSNSDDNGRRKR